MMDRLSCMATARPAIPLLKPMDSSASVPQPYLEKGELLPLVCPMAEDNAIMAANTANANLDVFFIILQYKIKTAEHKVGIIDRNLCKHALEVVRIAAGENHLNLSEPVM